MPWKPKHPCGRRGCSVLTLERFCAAHEQQYHRAQDQARGSAAMRGYDHQHRKWRRLVLERDPLCKIARFCNGRALSTQADHIIPTEAGGARFDLENGQGACKRCHSWKTATQDAKFTRSKQYMG